MKSLNVCFVGIGSIAKRHIANLFMICKEKDIILQIDCFRRKESKPFFDDVSSYIHKTYFHIDDVPNHYDVVFVTNPTSLHLETIKQFSDKTQNFFIEKPVCDLDQLDEIINLENEMKEKIFYIACPLRYTGVIQYIKSNIDFSKVFSIRAICSSYLPDWRAGIDYRETYSAHKELGGGVSIDLIHEWDYIYYLLGAPLKTESFIKTVSSLEITSDDIAIYIADYGDKTVELHLDYFGRSVIRKIELFTQDDTIVADISNSKITFTKANKIVDFSEKRNDFQKNEMINFIKIIMGEVKNENSITKAVEILKITGGI